MSQLPSPYHRPGAPAPLPDQPPEFCQYCGAQLNPFFYFCLGCATPYKAVNSVVTPAMPRQLTDSEMIQKKVPQVATVFWTFFGVVLSVGILSLLVLQEKRFGLFIFLNDMAIGVTTCIMGVIYWSSLKVQFTRFGFNRLEAYLGLLILIPLLWINFGIQELSRSADGTHKDIIDLLIEDGFSHGMLIFSICIFPAITEEIAFRGLVQHWLHTAIAPWKAIVFASFLFVIPHFSLISFPYLFAVGALLGWTKWKTGSLYPSMLIHFLHNLAVVEYSLHRQ